MPCDHGCAVLNSLWLKTMTNLFEENPQTPETPETPAENPTPEVPEEGGDEKEV